MVRRFTSIAGFLLPCLLLITVAAPWQSIHGQNQEEYDNTEGLLPPSAYLPQSGPGSVEVITTPDGFDNFKIGTDFAEPHGSANPLNPTQFFNAYNTNATHYTSDGHDWEFQSPAFGFPMRGDPVTAYDSLGNLYYENMYGSPSILGCKVIRSTDNGATWGPAVTSIDGVDKNWIACDQTAGPFANYVYTTMTAGGGVGNFARSTDFGATWQTTFSPSTQSLPGMMVAVGPNVLGFNNISGGCVYVVTNSGSSVAATYTFYRSTDGGLNFDLMSQQNFPNYVGTFVNGRNSVEGMRTRPYPFITADNSFGAFRGRLYIVYASNEPAGNGNKPDVFCRYSDDQGATWSDAVTINDDLNTANNHNWMPAVWCDKETGRVYAKWYDSRNSALSDSTDVYASYSDDGGVTWAPNQRITNQMFKVDCATCGGGGNPRYQGDYDAITSNSQVSMAIWTDFREGTFGSYVAYFPDFAMKVSPAADTMGVSGTVNAQVSIPAVKLYDRTVRVTATASPAANITFNFPQGDSLTSLPDSLSFQIVLNNVPQGDYEITVEARGPNGTPVHRRIINILATEAFVDVRQPNGGEEIFAGTVFPILWTAALVDTLELEYSTDGGASWIPITEISADNPLSQTEHPKSLVKPELPATSPGLFSGYEWVVPNTPSTNCLVRIFDKNNAAISDSSDAAFSIVSPPQPRWRAQTTAVNAAINSVSMVDTSIAWAAGAGGNVLRTTNGGNSWTTVLGNVGGDVFNIFGFSSTRAYVAVLGPGGATIQRTLNGGFGWQTVYTDTSSSAFINGIYFFDGSNGFAVGDPVNGQWTLLRTTDSGLNWTSAASLPQDGSEAGWNNSISWSGTQNGWFGTSNSRVYRTTDGGSSWTPGTTPFTNSLAVSFIDPLTGMSTGSGTALSVDGGATWSSTPAQVPGTPFGAAGLDLSPARWYFVSGTNIYKTSDLGNTAVLDFTQGNTLLDIDMKVVEVGGNMWISGYAVGEQGTIVKYSELVTLTDINPIGGAVPERFSLGQNYPNPFNPSTSIVYTLPEAARVTLEIVNVLGQKVSTLVDQPQNAGAFEVVWNGRDSAGQAVASGVYFYRLEASTPAGKRFSDIKRMLLLK